MKKEFKKEKNRTNPLKYIVNGRDRRNNYVFIYSIDIYQFFYYILHFIMVAHMIKI